MRSVQWRLTGLLLRNASSLIAVSRYEADMLTSQAGLGERRVVVIRNGGTLPPPSAETAVVPGRIISTGRLVRYKGHHRLIEALPYVQRHVPEAHVLILGSGSYEGKLRELAHYLGVLDRVIITHLPPEDRAAMSRALAESSVVAALSEYEAHPVAVMEALSAGRPVVGYNIAGIGELVSTGWVQGVSPGAPAAAVAHSLVVAMSAPSLVDPGVLPTWESCAAQLSRVYLATARFHDPLVKPTSSSLNRATIDSDGHPAGAFKDESSLVRDSSDASPQ
jgi:glycosyltransferase involved in cell wall biosynthesis